MTSPDDTTARAGGERLYNLVRQEHPKGCMIAALAMVTGVSYADVARDVEIGEYGVSWIDAYRWLSDRGYAVRTACRTTKSPELPPPFADVHLAFLQTTEPHVVVVLRDGTVLDPNCDEPGRIGVGDRFRADRFGHLDGIYCVDAEATAPLEARVRELEAALRVARAHANGHCDHRGPRGACEFAIVETVDAALAVSLTPSTDTLTFGDPAVVIKRLREERDHYRGLALAPSRGDSERLPADAIAAIRDRLQVDVSELEAVMREIAKFPASALDLIAAELLVAATIATTERDAWRAAALRRWERCGHLPDPMVSPSTCGAFATKGARFRDRVWCDDHAPTAYVEYDGEGNDAESIEVRDLPDAALIRAENTRAAAWRVG